MRDELKGPEVVDIGVAVVKESNEKNEEIFNVYLLNYKSETLESCLVACSGYGNNPNTDEKIKTSTLRYYLNDVAPKSSVKIEPILPELFSLNNEYWVSFWIKGVMFDKKFVFLPESISDKNSIEIPLLHQKGVLIK
jgi:hypothetical protein